MKLSGLAKKGEEDCESVCFYQRSVMVFVRIVKIKRAHSVEED